MLLTQNDMLPYLSTEIYGSTPYDLIWVLDERSCSLHRVPSSFLTGKFIFSGVKLLILLTQPHKLNIFEEEIHRRIDAGDPAAGELILIQLGGMFFMRPVGSVICKNV